MIKFYVTDENANRREFARYDNGKWSGNSRAVLVILEHKEWPQLGDRTFDKNNPEDYDMLPELFNGSYMWAEKVVNVRSPNA
jgi:hypothetical protein